MVNRFDVFLVNLDAEPSKDARNTRPCIIISPDEMNRTISSVIIAPLSVGKGYPTHVPVRFLNGERAAILDQIRTIDTVRLVKRIGVIDKDERLEILKCLADLFSE